MYDGDMNKQELAETLQAHESEQRNRQTKRALIGTFVVIPGAVLVAVAIWLIPRLLEM